MGQCSSTSKQQRSKLEALQRFDAPVLEEEDDDDEDDIVQPQLSGPRQQRRAIDDRARDQPADRKDFGLTSLRPSLDDQTAHALLALAMGRGSSVGGMLNTNNSGLSADNVLLPLEAGCSPKIGMKPMESGKGGPRPSVLSKPAVTSAMDSNERLEKLLDKEAGGNAPQVPPISTQG